VRHRYESKKTHTRTFETPLERCSRHNNILSLAKFVRYVEDNPVVAGLVTNADEWQFGSRWTGNVASVAGPIGI
jgi:hypothetical protein